VVFLFELLVSQQAVKKIGINGVAKGGSEKDRLSKSVVKGCEVKSEHRAAQGRGCWSARQRALYVHDYHPLMNQTYIDLQ
jgi:hypothetical protein